jgi:hypothetical protein
MRFQKVASKPTFKPYPRCDFLADTLPVGPRAWEREEKKEGEKGRKKEEKKGGGRKKVYLDSLTPPPL